MDAHKVCVRIRQAFSLRSLYSIDHYYYSTCSFYLFFQFILGHKQSRIRRTPANLQVAFFASRSQPQIHMGDMQNVLFDHVETNLGNSYDPYIGVFRAPEAGTYVFSTTLGSYDRNSTHFGVYKNTRRVSLTG